MYGLWRRPDQDIDPIRTTLLEQVAPALLDLGVAGLRVCVEEPEGKAYRVGVEPGRQPAGRVRLDLDRQLRQPGAPRGRAGGRRRAVLRVDRRRERGALATATTAPGPTASSRPACRSPPSSTRRRGSTTRPSTGSGTASTRRSASRSTRFWLYVRNQVLRSITPGAPPVRGIVYEAVPTDEHMLDFTQFFGCADEPDQLMDNIQRVDDHMDTFGNTATLQCVPMREWIFRTLST